MEKDKAIPKKEATEQAVLFYNSSNDDGELNGILTDIAKNNNTKLDDLKALYNNKKSKIKELLTSTSDNTAQEQKADLIISRIPRDDLNAILNSRKDNQAKLQDLKDKFKQYTEKKIKQNEGKQLSNICRRNFIGASGVLYIGLGIGAAVTAATALGAASAGVGAAVAGAALVAGATYVHYSNKSLKAKNENLTQEINFINDVFDKLEPQETGKIELMKKDIYRLKELFVPASTVQSPLVNAEEIGNRL